MEDKRIRLGTYGMTLRSCYKFRNIYLKEWFSVGAILSIFHPSLLLFLPPPSFLPGDIWLCLETFLLL
jgi:hypothetical protein